MFYLIGVGNKIKDINQETIEVLKEVDLVYLEFYTSFYENSIEELEDFLDKKIIKAKREVIEIEIDNILNKNFKKNIALLVTGDPLSATTHVDVLERCREKNIKYKVINNISIFTSIGRTGLQIYKFGKTTSIPFFNKKFMPQTPIKTYYENSSINAHTLFLLDIDPINNNYLKVNEALEFLLVTDFKNELDKGKKVVVCSKLNTKKEKIIYDTIENIIKKDKEKNLEPPVCLVIPSKLHFAEEEYLNHFKLK